MESLASKRIIDAAFALYKKPNFSPVSLSRIAAKAGITKAAIFRHFKNKNDLDRRMQERLFEILGETALYLIGGNPSEKIILYYVENPEYINFILEEFFADAEFEKKFCKGANLDFEQLCDGKKIRKEKMQVYTASLYCISTFFFFVQSRAGNPKFSFEKSDGEKKSKKFTIEYKREGEKIYRRDEILERERQDAKFARRFLIFLKKGAKKHFYFDPPLTKKRMDSLDRIFKKNAKKKANSMSESKYEVALAELLEKEKPENLTIKKIAQALNVSSSSLYGKFSSREDFFVKGLHSIKKSFEECLEKNSLKAETKSEKLYAALMSLPFFLSERPGFLRIFSYLRVNRDCFDIKIDEKGEVDFPVFVSITIFAQAVQHEFSESQTILALRSAFFFITSGIGKSMIMQQKNKIKNK